MATKQTIGLKDVMSELIPPANDARVGRKVFKLLEAIIKFKAEQNLPQKWHRCYELTQNQHWRNPTTKVPLVTANLCRTHRERTTAMLTDNNPVFNVKMAGKEDDRTDDLEDALVHTTEHWWLTTEQQGLLEKSVTKGETNGITIEKVRFDEDEEYGIGEVVTDIIDPYYFGWYPVKSRPEKAKAMLNFETMTVREARQKWPKQAARIISDRELLEQIEDKRLDVKSAAADPRKKGFWSSIAGVVKHMVDNTTEEQDADEEVLIVECWVKDSTRIVVEGGQEVDLYPGNIRCITCCSGGEVVLEDRPNPSINWDLLTIEEAAQTYLFSRFPFNIAYSIDDNANNWGTSDLEQLEGLNLEIDKTISQIGLRRNKTSGMSIINPENSGVANSKFTNAAPVINPTNHIVSQAIRWLENPPFPKELIDVLQVYREYFFLIAGSFDLEQGQVGEGAIAYKAIAALLERVATLLRRKLRSYQKLIRVRGRMYISCAQNWYVTEHWISYEVNGDEKRQSILGKDMIVPAKLEVVSGSTMPVSKVQQREEAISLYQMGAIDRQELLKKMDWPEWKEVNARMDAGVQGMMLQRLMEMGMDEQAAGILQQVFSLEQDDFEKAMEKGEVPMLDQIMAPPEAGGGQQTNPSENAEIEVKMAQVEKIRADIQKVFAEIQAIQAETEVKFHGVEFDREKLSIERARTVNDMRNANIVNFEKLAAHEQQTAQETKTPEAKQKAQGPYREKGMKSNNQQ